MPFSYRRFRKQLFRARRAHQALARKGAFLLHLKASAEAQTTTAQFTTPEDAEAVRFAVVMRPFPDPSSDYHYRRVWDGITAEVAGRLSPEDRRTVLGEIATIENGQPAVLVNGQRLKAEETYHLLAQADFFDSDRKAQGRLTALVATPVYGPFVWYQFYSFTVEVYHFLQRLHRLARECGVSHHPNPPTAGRCLLCLRTDRSFKSEEHVLPEALGNDEYVLPPGMVCDECNNRLSTLDQELVDFPPIAALRVVLVPHDKHGHLITARFAGSTWKRTAPRCIEVESATPPARSMGEGDVTLTVKGTKRFSPHAIARATFKIGLEMVALGWGHAAALDPKYDETRRFITGERPTFPGRLSLGSTQPHPGVKITIWTGLGAAVVLDVFGVLFRFALEPETPGSPRFAVDPEFQAFDLSSSPPTRKLGTEPHPAESTQEEPETIG